MGLFAGSILEEADFDKSKGSRWDTSVAPEMALGLRQRYAAFMPSLKVLNTVAVLL